jgi:low temperature requirement protein LtrA
MLRLLRLHTVPAEGGEGATWLELFFDLIYVAILVELGSRLSGNLSLQGTIEFALLFVPIWWSWLGLVFYTRYFPTDDIGQRLLTVAYMGAMILLAFEIHGVTGSSAGIFLVTYGITKFILAVMYARAWVHYPEYRNLTAHYVLAFSLLGLFWILIALVAPTNFWLWGLAVAIDVFSPAIIRLVRRQRGKPDLHHPPVKYHYMMHRFGELTIIVLGEFFIKLITSSDGRTITGFNVYTGACLLGISVSLGWLYFDHLGHASLTDTRSKIGVWMYNHYPLLAAITAYGVVGTKVFATSQGEILSDEKRYLLTFALAIAVLALGIIDWASPEHAGPMARKPNLSIRIIGAALLILLGILGRQLGVGLLTTLVVLILLIQVGYDIYSRHQESGPIPDEPLAESARGHA